MRIQKRPHHTAIVEQVNGDGSLVVLEQNAPKGDPVARNTLFFKSGTTRVRQHEDDGQGAGNRQLLPPSGTVTSCLRPLREIVVSLSWVPRGDVLAGGKLGNAT